MDVRSSEQQSAPTHRAGTAVRFDSTVSIERGNLVVTLRGELDRLTKAALADTLAGAISSAGGDVTVEMGQLDFIDSAGASLLLCARDFLRSGSRELILRSPKPAALRLFCLVAALAGASTSGDC